MKPATAWTLLAWATIIAALTAGATILQPSPEEICHLAGGDFNHAWQRCYP